MIATAGDFVRRAGRHDGPRARRFAPHRPTLEGLEGRALLAVDLTTAPIRTTAHATTGLIAVATIAAFPAAGAAITPQSPGAATISWGDGTSSTAIVQVNLVSNDLNDFSMGRYGGPTDDTGAILGAHTYARPGTYPVGVTLTDATGHATSSAGTATVLGKAAGGFGTADVGPLSASAGVPTGLVPVATFTEAGAKAPRRASAYQARIDWGDGGQSAGVVRIVPARGATATIAVLGAHDYSDAFLTTRYTAGATVTLSRAGAKGSTTTVVHVATGGDANPTAATVLPAGPLAVQRGRAARAWTVARFREVTSGGIPSVPDVYSAQVDWGDGTSSAGAVRVASVATVYDDNSLVHSTEDGAATTSNFVLEVTGRHAYRRAGTRSVVTTLAGAGLSTPATTIIQVR